MPEPQSFELALDDAYIALVKVLHINGSLDVRDLTKEIGDTIDFRRRLKGYEGDRQLDYLVLLHQRLLRFEPMLAGIRAAKAARPPAPE
jgi:hypothetical protein